MTNHAEAHHGPAPGGTRAADPPVVFLIDRLTEELSLLWEREESRDEIGIRPGLAAQIAIIDDLLVTLRSGLLPQQGELRMLLYGYGTRPDYDADWIH